MPGAAWTNVATNSGHEAPTQIALNSDSGFHATVNIPAQTKNSSQITE